MKTIWPIFYTESTAMLWKWLSEIASLGMKLNNSELLSMIRTLRLNCFADVIKQTCQGVWRQLGNAQWARGKWGYDVERESVSLPAPRPACQLSWARCICRTVTGRLEDTQGGARVLEPVLG